MGDGSILQKDSAPFKTKKTNGLTSFQPDLSRMTVSLRSPYKTLAKKVKLCLKKKLNTYIMYGMQVTAIKKCKNKKPE
jgi:hypothetical protein